VSSPSPRPGGDAPACQDLASFRLVGQITSWFRLVFPRDAAAERTNRLRGKTHFARPFKSQGRLQFESENFSLSFLQKSWMMSDIPPRGEGRTRGRHDARGGDAMDVTALASVNFCADEQGGCGREVVWSWRPGAGAKSADACASRR
jgi:hypothetical protein